MLLVGLDRPQLELRQMIRPCRGSLDPEGVHGRLRSGAKLQRAIANPGKQLIQPAVALGKLHRESLKTFPLHPRSLDHLRCYTPHPMSGTRSLIGVALGGTCFALLLLIDRIGLAYTVLACGGLALALFSSASLNWQILVAAGLGVASGLGIQSSIDPADALRHVEALRVIGSLFIAALKMFIAPMILLSIVYGIARMAAARELGRIGVRTVALYLFTMALAVSTGLILVNIFQPGVGSELIGSGFLEAAAGASQAAEQFGSVPEFLYPTLQQILSNPFSSLSEGRILPIVVFAILFGVALLQLGPAAAGLIEAIGGGYQAIMKIIGWILRLAPIGIFALIAKLLATVPFADLALHLGEFAGVVILGTLIHACITLPLIARLLAGISPLHLFRAIRDALLVAFSTSSSAATLPVTTRCVEENLGVPSHVRGGAPCS